MYAGAVAAPSHHVTATTASVCLLVPALSLRRKQK
jgi:hypothetical protein